MSLAHVTLATRDLKRASAFFHEVMDWPLIGRPENSEVPTAWLRIAPGQELHLVEVAGFEPSPFDAEYGRHIALSVPRARFPILKDRLVARGAQIIDPLRATPFDRFFFRDLDGYLFEVLEDERTREVLTT